MSTTLPMTEEESTLPTVPTVWKKDVGRISLITAIVPSVLGKVYRLGLKGVDKKTAGQLVEGTVETREFTDVNELVELLCSVTTTQAISSSLPLKQGQRSRLLTKEAASREPNALTRTKTDLVFRPGQRGLITMDYDPPQGQAALPKEELWNIFRKVCPVAKNAGAVWWSSSSSCIFNRDEEHCGVRGQRLYVLAKDIADTTRFGEVLAKRLWLCGHGYVKVSRSGQKLLRSTFDSAMFEAARMDFIGGAICHPPLEQRRGRPIVLAHGSWLDTRSALPDLTPAEETRVKDLIRVAKDRVEHECVLARKLWRDARIGDEVKRLVASGVPLEHATPRAECTLASAVDGALLGDFTLVTADGQKVTVADVLADPARWHGQTTLDPLEPEYHHSAVVGKIYLRGTSPVLHSFAHGGRKYKLFRQPTRLAVQPGHKADLASKLKVQLEREPDIFVRGGQLVQIVDGRLKHVTQSGLMHLAGSRYALFSTSKSGKESAADLPVDVANMLLDLVS